MEDAHSRMDDVFALPTSLDDVFDELVHSSGESEDLSPDPPTEERPKRPWQQPEARLRLGERVETRWSGDRRLYEGHVEALDEFGNVDVLFDDGLRECRVAPALVQRVRPKASVCLMELDAQTRNASPRRLPEFFPFPVIIAPWRLHSDVEGATLLHSQTAPRPAASKTRPPPKPPPKARATTPVPPAAGDLSSSSSLQQPPARGVDELPAMPGNRKHKRAKPSFETEVMLCCHKMPHEGGCFTCTLPFGHLCPHETGPVGPRKRAPARSRQL